MPRPQLPRKKAPTFGRSAGPLALSLMFFCGVAAGQQSEGPNQPENSGDRPSPRLPGRSPLRVAPGTSQPRVTGGDPVRPENQLPAGAQTGDAPGARPGDRAVRDIEAQPDADIIEFTAFAEGVDLKALVEFVAETLEIQVAVDPTLTGTVAFTSGFTVPREELLVLLNSLLEQQGFTITQEAQGWYTVRPASDVRARPGAEGQLATTKLIRTPNLKPSSLQIAIETQLGARGVQIVPGQGQQPQSSLRIAYLDDLGVIVMTDTPGRVKVVSDLVEAIVREQSALKWQRFELNYIAAPVARDRAIELVGGTNTSRNQNAQRVPQNPNQPQQNIQAASSGVENFADRLRVDPLGNALIFRGREDEVTLVQAALNVIDQPSRLVPKRYFAGIDARSIANLASQRGLGEVTFFDSGQSQQTNQGFGPGQFNQQFQQMQQQLQNLTSLQGGPSMVVDEYRGYIMYAGTPEMQEQMEALIGQFKPEDEAITINIIDVKHGDAQELVDLLRAVILGEEQINTGGLLPQNQGGNNQNRNNNNNQNRTNQNRNQNRTPTRSFGQPGDDEMGFSGDPSLVEITADTANNQLVIKAPARSQQEIARIVAGIDIRRPQVYIDVKIVAISDSEATRLAFETQLINAQGSGGVLQQNWGLTGAGAGGILSPRTVAAGLPGLTGAIILSEYVPFVMTATEDVSDVKLVSNPTILIDDNEEAEIISVTQEPTTTTNNIGNGQTTTTFQGYEPAGTTMLVTPRISAGGYMRLTYEITLSNFDGVGVNGIPPRKIERTIRADSVTIPGDATIVVGGIKIDDSRKTVARLPFIGEIPLIGLAFSDTRTSDSGSILYVFITPRILSDRNFGGHRLLTEGPRRVAEIAPDIPPLQFSIIPLADARAPLDEPSGGELQP